MVDCAYEDTSDIAWTEKAHEMVRQGTIVIRTFITDGVLSAHVNGPCPRCEHRLDVRETLSAAVAEYRSETAGRSIRRRPRSSTTRTPIDIGCECGRLHPDAPDEGPRGCGVTFRLLMRSEN